MRTRAQRVTGPVVALGFLAGWLTASWTQPPTAVTQVQPRRPAPPAPPPIEVPRVALHAVSAPETHPAIARDPFRFGGRAVAAVGVRSTVSSASASVDPAPLEPAPAVVELQWRLVGMASTGDAPTTAVLSRPGEVLLVSAGDRLPDGTEVVRLEPGQVILALASGETRTLVLP